MWLLIIISSRFLKKKLESCRFGLKVRPKCDSKRYISAFMTAKSQKNEDFTAKKSIQILANAVLTQKQNEILPPVLVECKSKCVTLMELLKEPRIKICNSKQKRNTSTVPILIE